MYGERAYGETTYGDSQTDVTPAPPSPPPTPPPSPSPPPPLPGVENEEIARAMAYRNQMGNLIAFRANQLRRLAGSVALREAVHDKYRKIYDPTNYIEGEPESGGFPTIYDYEQMGDRSGAKAILRGAKPSRSSTPPPGRNIR